MKNFLKAFIQFFKTSPLSRRGIILHLSLLGSLGFVFVWGGVHVFRVENDFSALLFVLVGIAIIGAAITRINPESCKRFWTESLSPDDSRLDG